MPNLMEIRSVDSDTKKEAASHNALRAKDA
jgi:hypothetical protein